MSFSAGSIIARASSGSRSSINSVEPLISANSALTVLRSPSSAVGASGWIGVAHTTVQSVARDDQEAVSEDTASMLASAPSAEPHLPQKSAVGVLAVSHFGQCLASALPHFAQKLLSEGVFV